jgi:translocation and assembly module TamA
MIGRSLSRFAGVVVALGVLGFSGIAMAGIDVRINGLGSDEKTNAYATLGILEYAKRVDVERAAAKKAGKTPDGDDLNGDYDPEEVQRLYEQGPADIQKALQPFGWYKPQVKPTIEGTKPDWVVTYDVTALPQTTVTRIDIVLDGEGRDFPPLVKVQQQPWPLHVGDRLKHDDYDTLKGRLLSAAQENGYLDAQFTRRELRIDLDNNAAEVLLTLDTGPRYYFGNFVIEQAAIDKNGKPKLKDVLLRRYVKIVPGDPYQQQKVLDTQFALSDLGYFQNVEIEPERSKIDAQRRVPLIIHTTPRNNRAYKYGVGYGTDTGARALVGAEFRRLNDDGDSLKLEVRPSQIDSSGIAEYKIPVGTNAGDSVTFTGKAQTIKLDDGKEQIYTAGTALNRRYGKLTRRLYLDYTIDDFTFDDSSPTHSKLITPGVTFNYLDLDDPVLARRGWSGFIDLHGAVENVISDTQFLSARYQLKGVMPLDALLGFLPPRKYRLIGRIEQGVVVTDNFEKLPPSQRFFAGGDDSVRGYAYQSIGPHDANGKVIGGRYLTVVSGEIEYALTKSWGIATFVDAGGADNVPDVSFHYGAGFGVRYRAPFGSVAIDLAHAFDKDETPVRLHLGVRVGF